MKQVAAIIKPFKFNKVRDALNAIRGAGLTVAQGYGRRREQGAVSRAGGAIASEARQYKNCACNLGIIPGCADAVNGLLRFARDDAPLALRG
jgi:hypothetical protein